ncbi:MAG TPA: ribosome-associated translation inhibitor RaiA [Streptosporangiaceae bacterium]|nr:ribosome-associated translation inhibitor RaiA [Streptosporangiaceae bacterium]
MDIIFKGRHTDVLDRFRKHATAKLTKIEKLDQKAIRIDVEVSTERNPRQSGRKECVELTITCRGPSVRAEAAAEDRFAAFDLAFAKLESRLRRASDRRKARHGGRAAIRLIDLPEAGGSAALAADQRPAGGAREAAAAQAPRPRSGDDTAAASEPDDVVPIEMEGDGPLVVREKFHAARPMSIDEALFEMELVGHDFFLFRDASGSLPSVVYRRRGYQYGVIRLVEDPAAPVAGDSPEAAAPAQQNGKASRQSSDAARLPGG